MATQERPQEVVTPPALAAIWSFDVRRVVYTALGIALYAILNIIFNAIQLPNAAGGAVALRPGIVIPILFGVLFGPVVGFLVGGLGNVIGDFVSFHSFYWNWSLGNALIGLIAGLIIVYTAGLYRDRRAFTLAEIAAAVAILIGIAFPAYSDIWVSKISFGAASSEFAVAVISDLINGLILLPILLIAYNAAIRRSGRA